MRVARSGVCQNAGFVRLWAGQTVSVFGSLIGGAALQFTAILYLGATPVQMGLLEAANLAPALLIGLAVGVWVDRLRRRPLLIGADLARALLLGSIPLAAFLHMLRMEQLYAVAALTGGFAFLFDVAYRAYLPSLVKPEELVDGNSKLSASASVAEIGGFGLGGWLVQALSGPVAILVDATSFLVSAACVRSIRIPEAKPAPPSAEEPFRRALLAGFHTIWRSRLLRALAASSATLNLAWGIYGAVVLLFVTRGLGFQAGVAGVLFSVGGLSSLLGALAAGRVTRRLGIGPALMVSLLCFGVTQFFIPLAQGAAFGAAALIVVGQLLGDFSEEIYEIDELSLRQELAPAQALGRVEAGVRFLSLGASLLGALLGGLLGQSLGLRATLILASFGTFAGALWLLPVWAGGHTVRIED